MSKSTNSRAGAAVVAAGGFVAQFTESWSGLVVYLAAFLIGGYTTAVNARRAVKAGRWPA